MSAFMDLRMSRNFIDRVLFFSATVFFVSYATAEGGSQIISQRVSKR
jgi:integral membrane sensor domain MASE1